MTSTFAAVVDGLFDWRRWGWLGIYDIRLQNRRSFVGMWWPTLSLAIFSFGVGLLFSRLMGRPLEIYLPHLALGWLTWTFIAGGVGAGTMVFIQGRAVLEEAMLPPNTLILRSLSRLTIQFLQGLVVVAAIFILISKPLTWMALFALAGLALNIVTLHGAMMFLGAVCARWRDLQHLVEAVMRFLFFMTPILWIPDEPGSGRSILVDWNPFYYMIEVVRGPLDSGTVSPLAFGVSAGLAAGANMLGILAFSLSRRRLIYWL